MLSKTRAKKEYFLRDNDLFDADGTCFLRNKTYDNYFTPRTGYVLVDGASIPPIREFLKRTNREWTLFPLLILSVGDIEELALKKWGGKEGFALEKQRRVQLRRQRLKTLMQNEGKRAKELNEALQKEGIRLPDTPASGPSFVRKRLREQCDNYIKHGGQKRAKYTLKEVPRTRPRINWLN